MTPPSRKRKDPPDPPVDLPKYRSKLPPAAEPWDKLRGAQFDVITKKRRLEIELANSAASHWAPNCGTFTRARARPIKGVKYAPPPLRSDEYPEGLPWLQKPRWTKMHQRVINDTYMAKLAAEKALMFHRSGRPFTLEHPGNSIARHLEEWKTLEVEPGVFAVFHFHCMFHPCKKKKFQVVYTNIRSLKERLERKCTDNVLCSRTREPHDAFITVVENGKVVSFGTSGTAEYPEELCTIQAEETLKEVEKRGLMNFKYSFLEVFSGPNAPLTKAVEARIHIQHLEVEKLSFEDMSVQPSARSLSPEKTAPKEGNQFKELSAYQAASMATGLQPKWNPSYQIIQDGVKNQYHHFELAKGLDHPGFDDGVLSKDLLECIENIPREGIELNTRRLKVIISLEAKAKELEAERIESAKTSGVAFQKMKSPLHIPLMKHLNKVLGIEDRDLPDKLKMGLPIVGKADESPFFHPYVVPAKISVSELLQRVRKNTDMLEAKILAEGKSSPKELVQKVFEKTQKEVETGTMSAALTKEQVFEKHGNLWNGIQRFGIEQGVDSEGKKKIRCIDNHQTSLTNDAAERRQKIEMASVSHIMLTIRALDRALKASTSERACENWELMGFSQDLKAAYRQCPLSDSNISLCITMVFNPVTKQIDYHELYGQPFGAGHAVPNFYRLAHWACKVARKLLSLVIDHFFDDFWIIEPQCLADYANWCFKSLMSTVGLSLDPEKEQLPAQVWKTLGIEIDMTCLVSSSKLWVQVSITRIVNTMEMLLNILKDGKGSLYWSRAPRAPPHPSLGQLQVRECLLHPCPPFPTTV